MGDFKEYSKIYSIGHKENEDIFKEQNDTILIEEKIDGANGRCMVKDGKLLFGNHHGVIGTLDNIKGGTYFKGISYIDNILSSKIDNIKDYIFYFEYMIRHILTYDYDKLPPVLFYDIYSISYGRFVGETKYKLFEELGLPYIKPYKIVKVSELPKIEETMIPMSNYGNFKCEGLVFKNIDKNLYGKLVRTEFKEESRGVFGIGKKYAKDDTELIIARFCTNPRIEKAIYNMTDLGYATDLELMHLIPKIVLNDIYVECSSEIFSSDYTIDFKKYRKSVSKRCFEVLNKVIINKSLK